MIILCVARKVIRMELGIFLIGLVIGIVGYMFGNGAITHQTRPVPLSGSNTVPSPSPKTVMVVGIDPGHGGIDPGTRWGKLLEKDINLKFSQLLEKALDEQGYAVVLTRDSDHLLTSLANYKNQDHPYKRDDLDCRLQKLRDAKAVMFISIHVNWNKAIFHRGPLVYYCPDSPVSLKIARAVQANLNRVQPYRKEPQPTKSYLLKMAKTPGILIELGFLSNPQDRVLLQDPKYLNQLISPISQGLTEAGVIMKKSNP